MAMTTGITSGPMPYIVVAGSCLESHTSTAASACERQRNDDTGTIDAPRRRTLRKVRHDLTRPTDFSTSVTRAFSFFRKSANASPER